MELIEYKNHFITYQWQGNDVNGNAVYLINIFTKGNKFYFCQNMQFNKRLDKYGNIRIKPHGAIEPGIYSLIDKVMLDKANKV